MAGIDIHKEESQMQKAQQEKAILSHLASLLVKENLISPEEQLRFLATLREE
ncbi:MAG: hypothetical protein Q4C66_07175 [Lachnospiraceae bacterium]|nr:hypothetical protein [Lachnospiraceae bacterium]